MVPWSRPGGDHGKKPFNPVIGETHVCWVDSGEDDGGISEFIGEQVSHHPPVSAFIVQNQKQKISITGDVTFKVGFGSNCASVSTGGEVTIHTSGEHYKMTKCVPDMMVNNVIWGEKYLIWHGTINITCSANQLSANIRLFEVEGRNLLEGEILDNGIPLYHLSGVAGKKTYYQEPGSDEKKLLVDISTYTDSVIQYLPEEVLPEFNSLKIWMPVKHAIIRNDMVVADDEKKKVEADQRLRQSIRRAEGTWKDAKYFVFQPKDNMANQLITEEEELEKGTWDFKNNFTIDKEYVESVNKEAEDIRIKKLAEKEMDPLPHPEEIHENNDTCSVQ